MKTAFKKMVGIQKWVNLPAWQKILCGLLLGLVVGLLAGPKAHYLQPIGDIFINAIHMMVVPVVFTAIVCAILNLNDMQKMRRVSLKAISLYAICMVLAAALGLLIATLIAPGAGFNIALSGTGAAVPAAQPVSLTQMIVDMVPASPVAAFAAGNILPILVFAVVLGTAINLAGDKAQPVADFFKSLLHVVYKFAVLVMKLAPYGIFALMACLAGRFGLQVLVPLLKYIGTVYLGFITYVLVVYCGSLMFGAKLSPLRFFRGIGDALIFAAGSSSSAATLPITIRCAEENLGVSKRVAGFLLPLGASLNLTGLSIYLGVATVFAANIYGIHLGMTQYLTVLVTIVLTSMGAGGVAGSALVVVSAVMTSIGIPLGAIPLVAGVDRINDIGSTLTNVTGDSYVTLLVAKSEQEWNEATYHSAPAAKTETFVQGLQSNGG